MKTPAQTQNPKALLLISGGIDSPVSGKLALEKGYELTAVHFSQEPFTDDSAELKSLLLCKMLGLREMIVVEAGEMLNEIAKNSYREYYFVLMKRFMMRTAEKIAQQRGAKFLITGESLGQVSSQTLSNLNNINQATKIEILRPVLFMNKQEIINKSREYGYFEASKGPEMCDALASGNAKTKSTLADVEKQEAHCNMSGLVEKAAGKLRIESTDKEIEMPKQIIGACK
ncbi:tRNA sulfurtransferase [uncultured archaeon]|nr:tRNA sulfurtransferase [uncultured archaeon]